MTDILARSPHRSASLAVLVAPDVPAVLIELGYLSNQGDAAQMNTDSWRAKVAGAIADAASAIRPAGSFALVVLPPGPVFASHATSRGWRARTELMFHVAIFKASPTSHHPTAPATCDVE